MKFTSDINSERDFSMSPMLDVIFLLLCFSLATQIFSSWEKEVDVELPTSVTGEAPKRLPLEAKINIKSDGTIVCNRVSMSGPELDAFLKRLVSAQSAFIAQTMQQKGLDETNARGVVLKKIPIILRGDRDASWDRVMSVIDLCRQNDFYNITFAVSTESDLPRP